METELKKIRSLMGDVIRLQRELETLQNKISVAAASSVRVLGVPKKRAGRPALTISITEDERKALKRIAASKGKIRPARNAKIILACASGLSDLGVVARVGSTSDTVRKIRHLFAFHRMKIFETGFARKTIKPLVLSPEERRSLRKDAIYGGQQKSLRAKALLASETASAAEVADSLKVNKSTLLSWRSRFVMSRTALLPPPKTDPALPAAAPTEPSVVPDTSIDLSEDEKRTIRNHEFIIALMKVKARLSIETSEAKNLVFSFRESAKITSTDAVMPCAIRLVSEEMSLAVNGRKSEAASALMARLAQYSLDAESARRLVDYVVDGGDKDPQPLPNFNYAKYWTQHTL